MRERGRKREWEGGWGREGGKEGHKGDREEREEEKEEGVTKLNITHGRGKVYTTKQNRSLYFSHATVTKTS